MWNLLEQLLYDNTIEEEYWRKMRKKSSSNSAIFVGLVAAIGGFLYGYDTGLVNDVLEMQYVMKNFPSDHVKFSTHERAIITAILSLGTLTGAILAPLISDNYGRKFSIILSSAIVFNIGNIFQTAASTVVILCVGRAISGVGIGMLSAVVPLYQAEASPKWVRGSVVFTYQWAITWGLLIASAICQGTRKINSSASYRVPIGLQFVWATSLAIGMSFLPESPRYYVQKDKIEQALESLSKLRRLPTDDADLIEELIEIKANYDYELSFGKTSYWDCFRNGGGRHKQVLRMFTGIGVQAFQQSTGINFIFYYGTNFFSQAGVPSYYIFSFLTYCVNTVFTIPGILLIDKLGRRKLLIGGGIGMAVSNLIIAIVGITVPSQYISSTVCITFSCLFIAFFASTWGGCAWALASDIFGISIRQKAMSITAATNWIINFVFAYITPYLIDTGNHTASLGTSIFFIWGGLNVCGTVFCYFAVYETKGLKLEEVDYMYLHCHSARSSTNFKSTKIDYENYENTPNSGSTVFEKHDIHDSSTDPKDSSNNGTTLTHSSNDNNHANHYPFENANEVTIIPYNNILSQSTSAADASLTSTDLSSSHNKQTNPSADYHDFIVNSINLNQLSNNNHSTHNESNTSNRNDTTTMNNNKNSNNNACFENNLDDINPTVTMVPILNQPDFDSDSSDSDSTYTNSNASNQRNL